MLTASRASVSFDPGVQVETPKRLNVLVRESRYQITRDLPFPIPIAVTKSTGVTPLNLLMAIEMSRRYLVIRLRDDDENLMRAALAGIRFRRVRVFPTSPIIIINTKFLHCQSVPGSAFNGHHDEAV